jgi:hypothetical protein
MFINKICIFLFITQNHFLIYNSIKSDLEWDQFMLYKKKFNKTYETFFELENRFKIFSLNFNNLLNYHFYNEEYPSFLHKDSDSYADTSYPLTM